MTTLGNFPWLIMLGLGLAVGFLSGLLGIGGGILAVPALVLLLGVTQQTAQGMSLALMAPVALMGAVRYFINPAIKMDFRLILILIVAAIIGTNIGTTVALSISPNMLRRIFAVAMIGTGIRMFFP